MSSAAAASASVSSIATAMFVRPAWPVNTWPVWAVSPTMTMGARPLPDNERLVSDDTEVAKI